MQQKYIRSILRWLWLLILIPVITGVAAFLYQSGQPSTYEAVTRLIVGPGISSPNPDLDSLRAGAQLMQTYAQLPRTDAFQEEIIDELDLDLTAAELEELVDIRPIIDTQILNIVVQDEDPERAIAIANAIGNRLEVLSPSAAYSELLRERIQGQSDRLEQDITQTEERVAELYRQLEREEDPTRQQLLLDRIAEEERALSEANSSLVNVLERLQQPFTNQVLVIDPATEAPKLSSQLPLTLLIALATGALISAMLAALIIYLDNDIIDYASVPYIDDKPILAKVGVGDQMNKEDYQRLAAQLIHQHHETEHLSTIIADTDTTGAAAEIATNLAKMLARANNNVLLVDADFHSSIINKQFDAGEVKTLADTLLTSESLGYTEHEEAGSLKVVHSGQADEKAFDLIASPKMPEIFKQFKDWAEYIIIVAPPLLTSKDALAIAALGDHVTLVTRQRKTKISVVKELIRQIEEVGGKVNGFIVTHTK